MYTKYFGLKEKPFDLSPDPKFLCLSESHKQAFAHLKHGLKEKKGFVVITGEVGTGKTTLLNALLQEIDPKARKVHLTDPRLTVEDLFYMIKKSLGLPIDDISKDKPLWALSDFMKNRLAKDEQVLLIIDESQNLSPTMLKGVRDLSNLESASKRLFQIFLVGQQELNVKLQAPELEQLRQRIGVKYHLTPLNLMDTQDYIQHRLKVAGFRGRGPFHPRAIKEIYKFSKGYPRLINILCDNALFTAYSRNLEEIKEDIIKEIIKDVELSYCIPKKKKQVHARVALAIILVLLSTGVPYGIYKSGGIKKTMPPELLTWIHREHRDKKVETLFGRPETAAQDEEMKVTNQETKLEEGSDSTAPVIKSKEDTTLDTVGPKDMGLPLKGESAKGIVLLRKGEEKEADAITDIESHMEGDILKIILTGNGAITKYKAFSLDDPTRLVIDVFEIAKTVPQRLIKINSPYVDRIRIGTHPEKVRLCLDSSMEELPSYHILRNENRLVIVISEIQKSETRELAPGKREGKVRIP